MHLSFMVFGFGTAGIGPVRSQGRASIRNTVMEEDCATKAGGLCQESAMIFGFSTAESVQSVSKGVVADGRYGKCS